MASKAGQEMKDRKGQLPAGEETPEERQLQQDLKYLDMLLARCRNVRTALPRMLEGMPEVARQHPDARQVLHGEAVNHMRNTGDEIRDFATLYTGEASKRVLDKAKTSRAANPQGIKTWLYQDHPDWADAPR
ncbi:hypothetical protein F4808DRAFT_430740 [Astrocystis sublimbata]|nr:hypothetical protein F4808DRAFT_430740 [Astrocystis sublimbata]